MAAAAPQSQPQQFTPSLIISGLPDEAGESHIIRHFEFLDKSLKVKSVSVLRDPYTSKSFRTARVKFFNAYDGTIG